MAGLDATGFVIKTLSEILEEIEDDERATMSASLSLLADSFLGQLNGIFSDKLRELWEVAQEVHNSFDPDNASGEALDNLAAITGVTRLAATESTVTLTATGTPATLLSAGRVVSVSGTGDRFTTLAAGTITAESAWTITTAYALDDRVTNSGNVYVCVTAGTSAGAGGPSGTGTGIADGTVVWDFVGAGTGSVDIAAEAEETGPIAAPTYTLTEIETPVAGWDSANNLADATPGTNQETDSELRIRREASLAASGTGTLPSIRSAVLLVSGVTDISAFENTTDVTDGEGRPPHSFQIVADGGDDTEIAQAIFDTKPAGIASYGATTIAITDADGVSHDINFDRPSDIDIYVDYDITIDAALYPGDAAFKQAIVDAAESALGIGDDVIAKVIECAALDVDGVLDITVFGIDTTPAPVATANIVIASTEIARFDTARITVTAT